MKKYLCVAEINAVALCSPPATVPNITLVIYQRDTNFALHLTVSFPPKHFDGLEHHG